MLTFGLVKYLRTNANKKTRRQDDQTDEMTRQTE